MLRRFNVKNFLSFNQNEEGLSEEFSMIPGKVRNKNDHILVDGNDKVLKFAAIYGANASGKSNLVKSLDFMRKVVLVGIPNKSTEKFCRTKIENRTKPSYFEVEIRINHINYTYGFEIMLSSKKILSEWLVELDENGKEKQELFSRNIETGEYLLEGWKEYPEIYERLKIYMSDISDDSSALFLAIMNDKKGKLFIDYPEIRILRKVYMWFNRVLEINYPDEPLSDYSFLGENDNVDQICELIASFGTGIKSYEIVKVSRESLTDEMSESDREEFTNVLEEMSSRLVEKNGPTKARLIMRSKQSFFIVTVESEGKTTYETIKFFHSSNEFSFGLNEESDGTIRLLDLLVVLLSSNNKTYVIDELDRCLHPCLTYRFVEEFLQALELNKVQLIVTTHESRLLDFDLLRRDEIWFVNKKNNGESDIYSLEEYNTRFDQKIDKAYLEGRYGGVPIFSTLFPVKESTK